MKIPLAAAVAALAASPAGAQAPRGDAEVVRTHEAIHAVPAGPSPCGDAEFLRDMEEHLARLKAQRVPLKGGTAPAAGKRATKDALASTLTAMRDGIEVGGLIEGFLSRNGVKVELKAQAAPSARSADGKAVSLSDALPAYPRVYAPWIASAAAELIHAGFPESGEKEYMRSSLMTRVWLELGGDKSKLPKVETLGGGFEDKALAARFSLWLKSYQSPEWGAEEAGKAAGRPPLSELMAKAKTAAERAAVEKAQEAFRAFTAEEVQWYLRNKGTVGL